MATLTKAAFISKWASLFPTNSTRQISAAALRDFRQDIADSFFNLNDGAFTSAFPIATAGGTNTYSATPSPLITAYGDNQKFIIKFTNGSTGSSTLDLAALGAIKLYKTPTTQVGTGDIPAGGILFLAYDSTLDSGSGGLLILGGAGGDTPTFEDVLNAGNEIDSDNSISVTGDSEFKIGAPARPGLVTFYGSGDVAFNFGSDATGDMYRRSSAGLVERRTPAQVRGDIGAEAVTNKDTDGTMSADSDTAYPSQKAVRTYVASAVVGLLDFRGTYDASGNAYPTSGGSGSAGAILKGDLWVISVAGTLPTGIVVNAGDLLIAKIDTPGSTQANWTTVEYNIGYTPENAANKDTDGTLSANSDTKYASQKAAKTYIDAAIAAVTIANASETVAGKVEEATDAEMQSGTATGGTGAKLFSTPAKLATWWTWLKTQAQTFSSSLKAKQIAGDYATLTDGATVSWDANSIGNVAQVTIAGNRTLAAMTNPLTGGIYTLRVVQDGTGGRTLAFNAAYLFPNSMTASLSSGANEVTFFTFFYNGTNFIYVSPGRVADWVTSSNSAKSITETGLNTSNSLIREWRNSALSSILKLFNDQTAEFGGTSSQILVNSGVPSDAAFIQFLGNLAKAYKFTDGSNDYLVFKSTTGDTAVQIAKPLEKDFGVGFKRITKQAFLTTTTTAATQNTVASIAIPSGYSIALEIFCDAVNSTGRKITTQGFGTGQNVGGTTGGSSATGSTLYGSVGPPTTGAFNINFNDTTDAVEIRFLNETGTGYAYDAAIEFTYILRPFPA